MGQPDANWGSGANWGPDQQAVSLFILVIALVLVLYVIPPFIVYALAAVTLVSIFAAGVGRAEKQPPAPGTPLSAAPPTHQEMDAAPPTHQEMGPAPYPGAIDSDYRTLDRRALDYRDACYDSEASGLAGDELNAYQATARNDPTRALVGLANRRSDLDRYFREEVVESEDREWWGRHEI